MERVERPKTEDEREHRVLTPDELRRLLSALDDEYRLIFRFAAETGARLGETLGLAWGDVDFEGRTVSISQQLDTRRRTRIVLKTQRSRRCIEIPQGW